MTHAIVLVEAERDVMSTLGGTLADVDGVREAYSVTGEWDFVCIVHVKQHEDLAGVVTWKDGSPAAGATVTANAERGGGRNNFGPGGRGPGRGRRARCACGCPAAARRSPGG